MAQPFQEKKTVEKVIIDTFHKNFLQPIIDIIGSCEVDAIICLSPLSSNNENQFVIKVHERLKSDRVDRTGVRNNGEPSILKKYLAGGTSTLTPESNHLQVDAVSRKRKAWDENDNAIYSGKRLINLNQVQYSVLKNEAIDEQDGDDNPLNLSDRCRVITETQVERDGKLYSIGGTISGRELNRPCFCGLCLLTCSSYKALQDHFVETHSSNLRFFCSECSTGFADSVAHTRHIAQHSGPNQSASNRRKQSKPRKGIIAHSDLSDDEIPQNKAPLAIEMHPSSVTSRTECRTFLSTSIMDQSEGIVKTLLQKQALPVGSLSESGMLLKRSSHSASSLSLIQEAIDANNTECCKCPHCEAVFDTFALYDEHCRMDHKRFACSFCLKTFTQRVNRDRHIHSHTGIRPFTCEHCGSDFKRQDALKKHREKANHQPLATVSTPSLQVQSSLNCQQLDQETSENSANEDVAHDTPLLLDGIENSETNDGNEGRSKVTSGDMHLSQSTNDASGSKISIRHAAADVKHSDQVGDPPEDDDDDSDEVSVHSYHSTDNGNPQLSDAGNTQSSDAGNRPSSVGPSLDDQLRPFSCDFCSEAVVGTAAYKEHCKVKHHRTPCISCGKTFSQKGNMERHMRQHTGERPFRCQFCQCAYTRKETLKTHINQAHSCKVKLEFDNL